MSDYDVIVIGAGCGGISSAAILAGQGRRGTLAWNRRPGGGLLLRLRTRGVPLRRGRLRCGGHRLHRDGLRAAGHHLSARGGPDPLRSHHELPLSRLGPRDLPHGPGGDGAHHLAHLPRGRASLAPVSPPTSPAWSAPPWAAFVSPANTMTDMLKMEPPRAPPCSSSCPLFVKSYEDVLNGYFKNEKVVDHGLPVPLRRPAARARPGLFALLIYSEHEGIWYPRGGMKQIPEAFRRVGESSGWTCA